MAHAPYPYMLSGNLNGSPPVNSIGAEGNYFFDESNGNIWGPKTNGVWPSPPATPAYPGGGGSPGGTDGQVQWNNAGVFDGFTVSGDGTLVTSTGVLTVTSSGGVAFDSAAFAATTAFDAAGTATAAVSAFAATLGSLAYLNTINDSNWSGTVLSVVNGGTGTSSPSLVAGTNVTITGTWPNQTINASGGGGGGSPGGNSGQFQYNNAGSFGGFGQILFADTTFYVDPTGNNANDGSIGSPWLTPQYSADQMAYINANGFSVGIQINDGTYSAGGGVDVMAVMFRPANCKFFSITGNPATPGNVIFDGVDNSSYALSIGFRSDVFAIASGVVVDQIDGFRFKNATAGVFNGNAANNVWMKNTEYENNVLAVWLGAYSGAYIENIKLIGNTSWICRAASFSNAYIFNLSGDTGATFDTMGFDLIDTSIITLDTPDYTNITASGGATQWFVDAFSKLNTGGVSVPGAAGTTDPLGLVI